MNADGTIKVKTVRHTAQPSTTLNRKYVQRPSISMAQNDKLSAARRGYVESIRKPAAPRPVAKADTTPIAPASVHPLQASAIKKMNATPSTPAKPTARELKEQAIKKALKSANTNTIEEKPLKSKKHFSFARVSLALACATVSVLAIAYLVKINLPDVSLRVAAMQTGIHASYPNYVPHNFKLDGISSEQGKITLNFYNSEENIHFSLTEESSSWDSAALLNNFVKENFATGFSIVKEQGLTIYMDDKNAAWVNQGMVYKLTFDSNTLLKTQIKSIATSL